MACKGDKKLGCGISVYGKGFAKPDQRSLTNK
jgi:hypothetical protein